MMASTEHEDPLSLEAARWLVALEDAPGDGDLLARFDAWLTADPAHAAAWADTVAVYDLMAKARPTATTAPASRPVAGPARAVRQRLSARRRWTLGVVGAVLAACLGIFFLPAVFFQVQADYATATAELRAVRLDDGSLVHLGPDSAIDVAFADGERRLHLLRGEAFFEVTRDPGRPFRVMAGDVETTVVGTAFDVRLASAGTEVAVRRGRVQVVNALARPPVSELLGTGDWVKVTGSGEVTRGVRPSGEVASWLQGRIIARDRSMDEVIGELRRYYRGIIMVADGDFAARHVTGVYNLSDPVAALRAMAAAHGGSVHRVSPWLLLVTGD
ncbi:MAG: FecR family protein [Kiloniellaceae bacterium]